MPLKRIKTRFERFGTELDTRIIFMFAQRGGPLKRV